MGNRRSLSTRVDRRHMRRDPRENVGEMNEAVSGVIMPSLPGGAGRGLEGSRVIVASSSGSAPARTLRNECLPSQRPLHTALMEVAHSSLDFLLLSNTKRTT